jgi:hypothetical protein
MLPLALAIGLIAALAAPAAARRTPRPGAVQKAKKTAKVRGFPRQLGEGMMSKVFLASDGRHVIKKVKPRLGRATRLSRSKRIELAGRSVAYMDVLRSEGVKIPRAVIPRGHPDMIVQELVVTGRPITGIPWRARPRALWNAARQVFGAMRIARRHGLRALLIDSNPANFRFDERGEITSWFDPVAPLSPGELVKFAARELAHRFGLRAIEGRGLQLAPGGTR